MKYFLIFIFLLAVFFSKANGADDTIIYWHISYGKDVILQGNDNTQAGRHEIIAKTGSVKDLTISISQDAGSQNGLLIIREKEEVLRKIEQDPVMGTNFVVPVRELISTHQTDVRYELDFYYTIDNNTEGRKLATIIFIFK